MADTKRIFVKPKPKLTVRHPGMVSRILKPEGEWVSDSIEWQRLIRDKDVTVDEHKTEQEEDHHKDKHKPKTEVKGQGDK